MPYDIADLKKIKIQITQIPLKMESTSEKIDYSFSNGDKLIIHEQNFEEKSREENKEETTSYSEIQRTSTDTINDKSSKLQEPIASTSKVSGTLVDEAITKMENILKNLKELRDKSSEDRRVILDSSKKRLRRSISSETSASYGGKSPSPKRTRKESFRRKYNSDSSLSSEDERKHRKSSRHRESSLSSSDRSCSNVSKELQKELFSVLSNSLNSKKNKSKAKKERYSRGNSESKDRSKRPRRGDSYAGYSRKSSRRQSDKYDGYNSSYQQANQADFDERYLRYYAVMYAFSIVIDILRQDDIYSNF